MKMRWKLLALVILLGGWSYLLEHFPNGIVNKPSGPIVLPPGTTEQVIVDPIKHQLIITTSKGTTTQTLPDRKSVFDVSKDGTVKITAQQFGYEVRPFVGAFFSNKLRFGAGVDGLYFKKLDLGLGVAGGSGAVPVVFVNLSYTIWDNVKLSVTYDHLQHIGCGVTVRI